MLVDILSQQVKGAIQNKIFNSVFSLTKGVDSPELRAVISRIAEELTVFSMNSSSTTIREKIPYYQRDLIGIYSPINTYPTSGYTRKSIQNDIFGIYGKQIAGQVENRAIILIREELRSVFPNNSFINFDVLTDTIIQSFSPSILGFVETTIQQVASNQFISTTSNLIQNRFNNLFSIVQTGINLSQINSPLELLFMGDVIDGLLNDIRNFSLGGQGDSKKLVVLNRGFIDPTANYPTPEYVGKSEINKLAQGDTSNTIVLSKDKNRMIGAKLPGDESWEQPISSFKGEYPYNKVQQTESGHVIEIDDTPGAERLHVYHRSGTFIEIDANGSVIKRATGSSYEIIDKNGKISIAGKADISVNGACNIFVGNDANIEVDGDTNLTCYNDITAQAGGTLNLSATEEINILSKKINIHSTEDTNIKSETDLKLSGKTDVSIDSENNMSINSKDNLHIKSNKNVIIHPSDGILLSAGKIVQVASFNFTWSKGTKSRPYNVARAKKGKALSKPTFTPAKLASKSNNGLLNGRKTILPINIKDPTPLSYIDNYTVLFDEEGQDVKEHRNFLITSGLTTSEIFDRKPVDSESISDIIYRGKNLEASSDLKKIEELPGNYRISPNFTIEMLSYKTAVTKDRIISTDNLKYGDIVYSLQALCLNCLEPAYALYPNMFITSCYRDPYRTNNKSQHTKGQAVDIQFRSVNKDDYYDIAVKLASIIAYDQFILEYCSYSNNPWIHISFTDNPRKQIMTFWNHKKHSDGLHRLA